MKNKIRELVESQLNQLVEAGQVWHPNWIANAVESRFQHILDEWEARSPAPGDADDGVLFYHHCAYTTVRAIVAEAIRKRSDPSRTTDDQLVFEGFPRVQAYYTVTRNEEWVGVPVLQLTHGERLDKVAELRSRAHALTEHADQLELFFASYEELGGA